MDLQHAREKHGTPDPEAVLPFVEYVAGALGYAHAKGIVHRDIKPRNLMTLKGDGRVLDFGIAAVLDPNLGGLSAERGEGVAGLRARATSVPQPSGRPVRQHG